MKNTLTRIILLSVALLAASCSKDYISPDELFKDSSKTVKTKIALKSGNEGEEVTTTFSTVAVYKTSDMEGQSWLSAFSGGRMVYDSFFLSLYFQNIDKMKIGDTLKPSRVMFTFPLSSSSASTTYEYSGKITLADKGDDYVILNFHKVGFSCNMGDYLTDGYLYCPLKDKFGLQLP